MASNFFAMISRLKYIDRWALMRNTHEENLSEHCMETACIAHALAVIGNRRFGKYYNAERAALLGLYHDAPETLTGDMPTPVKYYSPHIREAYAQVEQSACEHLASMLPEDLRADFAPFFFKDETDEELWKLGVSAKTQHNEVAPGQHELAPIYAQCNVAVDHNQLIMETLKKVAYRHNLQCLLHEKPFEGVNGSGKHNNWSLVTDDGINILDPGKTPHENVQFLLVLACILKAVDVHADLLRESAADPGNDHRLGANEAPPAIISIFLGEQLQDVVEQLLSTGEATHSLNGGKLQTGVTTLPDLTKDATDRNRTSPFAFTGNKFEFRMVASSMSISGANTVLNSIVADTLAEMNNEIEGLSGEAFETAVKSVIRKTLSENKRIIFNGNGYSDEWVAEAESRGLPNIKTTVDATRYYLDPECIAMFERQNVYTEAELRSREEINYETYAKVLHIEALTMIEMASKLYIPAVIRYCTSLAQSINAVNSAGAGADVSVQNELLVKASSLLADAKKALAALIEKTDKADEYDEGEPLAVYYKDEIRSAMDDLRTPIDELEMIVEKSFWPVPTYGDLLFEV